MPEPTKVAPMDAAKKNSPVSVPADEAATIMMDTAETVCVWNGQEFAEGNEVCSEGAVYECSFGKWVKTAATC